MEIVKLNYTKEQIELVRSQIAPKATVEELNLFLYQCQRTGLDALSRQIYAIHRGNKMTIQTSIDGFRVIAERSGDYAGQDEPEFIEQDGKLICCKVAVYRFKGEQRYRASVGVAYWSEYAQTTNPMWQKLPHTMLAKCAEALALRKAYPQDLSGLYTGDEMEQAAEFIVVEPKKEPKKKISETAFNAALARVAAGEDIVDKINETFELTKDQAADLFDAASLINR
jgi:phage recombination protein Bet